MSQLLHQMHISEKTQMPRMLLPPETTTILDQAMISTTGPDVSEPSPDDHQRKTTQLTQMLQMPQMTQMTQLTRMLLPSVTTTIPHHAMNATTHHVFPYPTHHDPPTQYI